jgi:YD repeat-containing protein
MSSTSIPHARSHRTRIWGPCWGVALLCVLLATGVGIAGTGTTRYQYDELGRLIRVELPDGHMIEYVYDAVGNILEARDPILDDDDDGVPDVDDCAPLDGDVYPGAPEINDGKDNQCPGDAGFGLVDEVTGPLVFESRTLMSWETQAGATMYHIVRSKYATFVSGCWDSYTPAPSVAVTQDPPAGDAHYYLVRAYMPHAGSWGADSQGSERTSVCP